MYRCQDTGSYCMSLVRYLPLPKNLSFCTVLRFLLEKCEIHINLYIYSYTYIYSKPPKYILEDTVIPFAKHFEQLKNRLYFFSCQYHIRPKLCSNLSKWLHLFLKLQNNKNLCNGTW